MKSKPGAAADEPASSDSADVPALPVWKAFVLQFSRETGGQTGPFAGRVEHMSSGRRAHFASTDELVAVLRKILDQLGEKER